MSKNKPKLLVTGISGFLGSYLPIVNNNQWDIHGFYNHSPINPDAVAHTIGQQHQVSLIKTSKVNLLEPTEVKTALAAIQPDAILHLAAQSNPNYCEAHEAESHAINVAATLLLGEYAATASIPFVFVSSDLVFDGTKAPYSETDTPSPISVYGRHKVEAEQALLQVYPDACIARCPVMYGLPAWGNSFMSNWIKNLREEKPVYAFTDEYRTKVDGQTAVEGLFLLLRKHAKGVYHLGGKEKISRYDFAVKMAKAFGLQEDLVKPSLRADVKMPAARPADVSLLSDKAYALGYHPDGIDVTLARIKNFSLVE